MNQNFDVATGAAFAVHYVAMVSSIAMTVAMKSTATRRAANTSSSVQAPNSALNLNGVVTGTLTAQTVPTRYLLHLYLFL